MRVAIADDGALFREGMSLLLAAAGHEVVGSYADGDTLLGAMDEDVPDVVVLDIHMPPGLAGGLTTAARVRATWPGVGLLLLSQYAETHYLRQVLTIGTDGIGYRLKDRVAGIPMLNETLSWIASREIVIEPILAARLVASEMEGATGPLSALTAREWDVLRLMAEGRANGAIAGSLFVSVKAVEKHVASIFAKLDLPGDANRNNRRVLAVIAYLESTRISDSAR